ncbi:MAG: hypothetical protein GF411_14020 [Candidatus Lokiarchaeota archaeon]|nr:hypothetical protein [Candidatus Lokiarchaeota archaeon]
MDIKQFIGYRYRFKYKSIEFSGIFKGIGESTGKYGMIFTDVMAWDKPVDKVLSLLIHPSQTKCVRNSGRFAQLRSMCRKIFKSNNSQSTENPYVPSNTLGGESDGTH